MSQNEEHDKNCNSNAPVVKSYCVCNCRLSKPGPTMSPSMNNPMSQKESEWTPSLSPYQEWRLQNGEGKVPEWFVMWSERVYATAVSNREKEIAEYARKMRKDVDDGTYCRNQDNEWKNGYDCAMYDILSILKH